MAQEPSDATPHTWSARVYIRPSVVTDLVHSATVSPDVVSDAQLTITRRFYDIPDDPHRMEVDGDNSYPAASPRSAMRAPSVSRTAGPSAHRLQREQSTSPSEAHQSSPVPSSAPFSTGRHATPGRASVGPSSRQTYRSPPPEEIPGPSTPSRHTSPASTSSGATSRQPSVSSATTSSRTSRRPITRSQSSSSFQAESTPAPSSTAAGSPSSTRSREVSVPPEDDMDDAYQYERVEKTCLPNDEEKRSKVRHKTIWFKSSGDFILSSPPPAMAKRPELELGDLFFHITRQHREPQMWLWCEGADGQRFWRLVQRGHLRTEDKRRLAVTEDDDGPRPSWLGESWFRVHDRKIKKSKLKGKGRATSG